MKFEDITFEKGILQTGLDRAAIDWVRLQGNVLLAAGALPQQYMRMVDVVRYNRMGIETRRWKLVGAWVKTLEYSELEGGNTENTIEKITICYQYWM
jgi:hypothetical protein